MSSVLNPPSRNPVVSIVAVSAAAASFLIWLIYFKGKVAAPAWVAMLPVANASFNTLSALCLILGFIQIRRGDWVTHKRYMLSAALFSTFFLVSYILYHFFHGDTLFAGHGWIRPVYFFILISHVGLSMIALPLILAALWYGLRGEFQMHRRVARWTFPVWLYVSCTGVVVYFLLKRFSA